MRPVSRPPAAIGISSPSVGQPDATREEEQHLFFRRREARVSEARFARDVAEVEHARVLEKELALLRKVQVELREVDLLFVRLGLREVGLDGHVERQRRRHAVLRVDADVHAAIERLAAEPRVAFGADPGLEAQIAPLARIGQPG